MLNVTFEMCETMKCWSAMKCNLDSQIEILRYEQSQSSNDPIVLN